MYFTDTEGNRSYLGLDCEFLGSIWVDSPGRVIEIDAGGSGGVGGSYIPLKVEDQIDFSKLKPCMKGIAENVINLSNGVGKQIKKFVPSNKIYNWNLEHGSVPGNKHAITEYDPLNNKAITTKFETWRFANASDISIARTMIHEGLHAYITAYLYGELGKASITFKQMWIEYGIQFYGTDELEPYQHAEMARNWTESIAAALQEYGENAGYNLGEQFYRDMAWGGLQETPAFDDLSPQRQKEIKDTNSIEQSGLDTNGNTKPQKGTKSGC